MPIVKTRYACPTCGAQVQAENRTLVCTANINHFWNDSMTFLNLNPQVKYEESKPPVVAQPNHVEIKVTVPPSVKTKFETKFGATASSTAAGIIGMLADGEVMIVPESDLQRMKERFGKKPESAAELFGLMYSLFMDLETANLVAINAQKDVQAYEGRNPNSVLVDLGPLYGTVMEKARDQNETAKMWIERNLKTAVENNWF